jgi:predicted ATP-grasp superfamily ATP-dependent carboligase
MDYPAGSVRTPPQSAAVLENDVARLKQEAEQLRQQLRETEQRLRHIEGGNPGRRSG